MSSSDQATGSPLDLLAVLLVTRSRPGPKLVFHYPPTPTRNAQIRPHGLGDRDDHDTDSSSDEGETRPHKPSSSSAGGRLGESANTTREDAADLSHLLGYSIESLEKVLSPGRWCDRKKFGVTLDDITFIGYPVYADKDGKWSHAQVSGKGVDLADNESAPAAKDTDAVDEPEEGEFTSRTAKITITAPQTPAHATHDFTHIPESLDSQAGRSLATSMNSTSTASGGSYDQMAMFHVVFVLSAESTSTIPSLYQHVVKPLSKALHYCQKQTDYVAIESRKLMAASSKAKQGSTSPEALCAQMVESSELSWALREVFEKIAVDEIAGIRLGGSEMSLQLPLKSSSTESRNTALGPHSGLLLLEEKEVLLRQLAGAEASPLSFFIREQLPTKSLAKHAKLLSMPTQDILYLARHLLKWRKARLIAPLHPRNFYVVARDAPLCPTEQQRSEYVRRFAALPTLSQMLKVLSGKPIRYGMLMPSSDHRAPYMEILAYLVQHGFVAQLETFGWLQYSSHRDTARQHSEANGRPGSSKRASTLSHTTDDETGSTSSGQTAIPPGSSQQRASRDDTTEVTKLLESGREDHLITILDPLKLGRQAVRAVKRIEDSLEDAADRDVFVRITPYLDGAHAMETMNARLELKRAHVERVLETLNQTGHLLTFQSTS